MSELANQRIGESANRQDGAWVLPDGWAWTTIEGITQPVEKAKPSDNPDDPFTYLDISSIDNDVNRIAEPKTYYGAEAPSRARQVVEANDVLFSTVRTYLRNIALVPEVYDGQIASTGFSVLRTQSGVLPQYLFYYSLTERFVSELGKLQRGTSYPAVRDGDVRAQPFPLAPFPEQRRIVAEIETQFTRLDAGVAALERVQANLRRYRAAVLKAACEGRLVPTEAELASAEGREYEPADQLLVRILAERRARWEAERWEHEIGHARKRAAQANRKAAGLSARIRDLTDEEWQSLPEGVYADYLPKNDRWKQKYKEPAKPSAEELSELPEGWAWATVQQLSTKVVDGTHHTPTYTDSGIAFISVKDIREGRLLFDDCRYISEEEHSELIGRCHPEYNDVLITKSGTIGRIAVVKTERPFSLFVSVALVKTLKEGLDTDFFKLALEYYILSINIQQDVKGGVIKNLHLEDLRIVPVGLPPLPEQHRIVAEVERGLSVVEALERAVEAALARARRLRQAVLKQAFEGRLVEQDPEDEPAAVLLERIRATREARATGGKKKKARQMRLPET